MRGAFISVINRLFDRNRDETHGIKTVGNVSNLSFLFSEIRRVTGEGILNHGTIKCFTNGPFWVYLNLSCDNEFRHQSTSKRKSNYLTFTSKTLYSHFSESQGETDSLTHGLKPVGLRSPYGEEAIADAVDELMDRYGLNR